MFEILDKIIGPYFFNGTSNAQMYTKFHQNELLN